MGLEDILCRTYTSRFTLSVPANLLLFGEYAVTQDQGYGLWLAPECRSRMDYTPLDQEHVTIEAFWIGGGWKHSLSTEVLSTSIPQDIDPLLRVCLQTLQDECSQSDLNWSMAPGEIRLDTSAFYTTDGRKMGFGSSAAACVLLLSVFISIAGRNHALPIRENLAKKLFPMAVKAHRLFQGGRGSGYDIAASLFGGTGIFVGGLLPQAIPRPLPMKVYWYLVPGPQAIKTPGAIGKFTQWKESYPNEYEEFKDSCRTLVLNFISSPDVETMETLFNHGRTIGIQIGEKIKVPAHIAPGVKALGAGNEIGLFFSREKITNSNFPSSFPQGIPLDISTRGLSLE